MNLFAKKSIAFLAVLFSFSAFGTVYGPSKIARFSLRQCSKENTTCLKVNAVEADGSQISDIFYLRNLEMEIVRTGNKPRILDAKSGYIDYANNQLVVFEDSKKFRIERAFDLKTLNEKIYRVNK